MIDKFPVLSNDFTRLTGVLIDRLPNIKCDDHYLNRPSINLYSYIRSLNRIIERLSTRLTHKEILKIIDSKLQVSSARFNEAQYIQAACELTLMSDYIDYEGFTYEDRITQRKDVDFSIVLSGRKYNVEVKCASYEYLSKKTNEVRYSLANRMPTTQDRDELEAQIRARLPSDLVWRQMKNLDNKLKDFLISTQNKVEQAKKGDVNVLIVCCDDELDMQMWRGYLFGEGGLFTGSGFLSYDEFDKVDLVLFANIYNRHFRYFERDRILTPWSSSSAFKLLYPNRHSKTLRGVSSKEQSLKLWREFNEIIPNHSDGFEAYFKSDDVPSGECREFKNVLGVGWYADKFKSMGSYYFREV